MNLEGTIASMYALRKRLLDDGLVMDAQVITKALLLISDMAKARQ